MYIYFYRHYFETNENYGNKKMIEVINVDYKKIIRGLKPSYKVECSVFN